MAVIYYCWLCDKTADPRLCAPHYETKRSVFFCGEPHRSEYWWLFQL